MIDNKAYLNIVIDILNRIEETQSENIEKASAYIKKNIDDGGILHAFSTGHSHMLVEEIYYRAGGLVPINPIFDPALMLHEGVLKSTNLERLPGYAKVIFDNYETKADEPIIIISNSGINPVPIEMGMLAKEKSMKVIALTSASVSQKATSRHESGLKLMDTADIVIDNCIEGSDASIYIEETGHRIAAVSTIAGAYILERLVISVANRFLEEGKTPPIFMSANVKGGYEFNEDLLKRYSSRKKGF